MKKILLLCSIAFMFACSDENGINGIDGTSNDTTNLSAKTVSDFDNLFYQHINSPIYLELNSKINLFTTKMKFTGDRVSIDTKEKMFSWISANLDTTDFTSISEAVSKWEEVENIATIDFQNNIEYYTEVTNNKSRFSELLLLESMKNYTTNSACKDQLNGCNAGAVDEYAGAMQGAFDAYLDGSMSGNAASNAMSNARAIYMINLSLCADEYRNCILG